MFRKQVDGLILEASTRLVEPRDPSCSLVPGNTIGAGLEEFPGPGNSVAKTRRHEKIECHYVIVTLI